jgi:hypothetical protein
MPWTLVLLPDAPRLVTSVISPTVIVCDAEGDPDAELDDADDEADDADDELEDGPDDDELVLDDFDDELQAAATMATHAAAASSLGLLWIMVMCPSVAFVVDRCSRRAQPDAVMASPR